MTNFTLIIYQRSKCGFHEDDWQIVRKITNEKEFLEALKEGYLIDAGNRNNYPVVSHPVSYIYKKGFLKDESVYFESLYDFSDLRNEWDDMEIPEDYLSTLRKFKEWEIKVQTLIPYLREKSKERELEQNKKLKLSELAKELGYNITKDPDSSRNHVIVGKSSEKLVTVENHDLYEKIISILEENEEKSHFGKVGVGVLTDWILENYLKVVL